MLGSAPRAVQSLSQDLNLEKSHKKNSVLALLEKLEDQVTGRKTTVPYGGVFVLKFTTESPSRITTGTEVQDMCQTNGKTNKQTKNSH